MKNLSTAFLAAVLVVSGCGKGEPDTSTSAEPTVDAAIELATLFDDYFERNLELNPLSATSIGDDRYDDRLAISQGQEYRDADRAMDEEFLARLLEIDRDALDEQQQLSYDIFRINRERSLESNLYPYHLQPVNQFRLLTNSFVQLGSGSSVHPFKTVKNYDDWLNRTEDFVTNLDQTIENMKQGMREAATERIGWWGRSANRYRA